VEGIKPTARLHKILAKDESYQIGGLRLPSGDFTASDQEVAHLVVSQLWKTQLVLFRSGHLQRRTSWWHRRL
jgi:hypothetical protein